MSLSIQPAKSAPVDQVHGLSMHPKVRAALAKGAEHEWTPKELSQLLGLSTRNAQTMLENGVIKSSGYASRKGCHKVRRRALTISVLNYLLEHSHEITPADAQPIIKGALPLMPDSGLHAVMAACQSLIRARAGLPVIVKEPEPVASATPAKAQPANVLAFSEFAFVEQLAPKAPQQATA